MTIETSWQPFQDLGEDDHRPRARDEMDRMRSMLDNALGRDGERQMAATERRMHWSTARPGSRRS